MITVNRSGTTEESAIKMLDEAPILQNRYFEQLSRGTLAQERFTFSQIQFFFAVRYFSRNLAALVARIPTSAGRNVLVHNLAEEHGLDERDPANGFRAPFAHDRTMARFLESLGVNAASLAAAHPEPAVHAFNLALHGACANEAPCFALAALGMIEYAFADISALIGLRVVELGWVNADDLVHYSLHAEIDQRHAAELFEAAEAAGGDSAERERGLAFGRYIFDRLYEDLALGSIHGS